jgi:hypothetical protein
MNHGKHRKHGSPLFAEETFHFSDGGLARELWLRAAGARRKVRTVNTLSVSVFSVFSVAKSIDPPPIEAAKR